MVFETLITDKFCLIAERYYKRLSSLKRNLSSQGYIACGSIFNSLSTSRLLIIIIIIKRTFGGHFSILTALYINHFTPSFFRSARNFIWDTPPTLYDIIAILDGGRNTGHNILRNRSSSLKFQILAIVLSSPRFLADGEIYCFFFLVS